MLAVFGLFTQVHGQKKYQQPELPKEELADIVFESVSDVHVRAIDGLAVSSSLEFFSHRAKDLHVYVVPGVHLLTVQVESTQSMGGTGGTFGGVTFSPGYTTIKTETSVIQVDLKMGHRYVIFPWYFNNANKVRFSFSAAPERNEIAKIFDPDNIEKYPWLNNIFYEIYDATDLPDRKLAGTQD